MVSLILLFLFCIFYWFTLFDPFLPSFKIFNARFNFPSIFLDFLVFFSSFQPLFEVKLFIFQTPYGMLLVCVLFSNFSSRTPLTFLFIFQFFQGKVQNLNFPQHTQCVCRCSENSTLINLFCFPSLFFTCSSCCCYQCVVLFSNWNFNYF